MKTLKHLLLAVAVVSGLISLSGAGSGTDYVQRLGAKGWIYHTFNKRLPATDKKQKIRNIKYDYTYIEQPDSVNLLLTIQLPEAHRPDHIRISCGDTTYVMPSEIIYADPIKEGFKCRIKTSFTFEAWQKMYTCEQAFTLTVNCRLGGEHKSYVFGYSKKRWKSERNKIISLQKAIKYTS